MKWRRFIPQRLLATSLVQHEKFVLFREEFRPDTTFWDKMHASLKDKLPRDLIEVHAQTMQNDIQQQALTHFWTFLKTLLLGSE